MEDAYWEGFWQDECWLDYVYEEIMQDFTFADADFQACGVIAEQIARGKTCAIHIRRGDYVGTYLDCLPKDYYERAIEAVRARADVRRFYVFSDDPAYAEKRFSMMDVEVVRTNQAEQSYRDMLLMARAQHNILSNSTFSYWSGVLNRHAERIVIAPQCLGEKARGGRATADWILI